MKVLLWSNLYHPDVGGIEMFARELVRALRPRGHEFLVVAAHGAVERPDVTTVDGTPVHRFGFRALERGDLGQVMQVMREVNALRREARADLVHMVFFNPGTFVFLRTARADGAPLLLTLQSAVSDLSCRPDSLLRRLLDAADWVVANSNATLADVLGCAPDIGGKASRIYNGLPHGNDASPPLADPPVVLGMGRLVPSKGFDRVIEAFASIRERHPSATLWLAGDGEARPDLEALSASRGIADRVRFLGSYEPGKAKQLIDQATLVVVPSRRRESFGLVAVEAAMRGRPVIATRVGGLVEVVRHGVTGLLVEDEDDSRGLAETLGQLLGDIERATAMGAAAATHAKTSFGLESCAAAYDELYRTLV